MHYHQRASIYALITHRFQPAWRKLKERDSKNKTYINGPSTDSGASKRDALQVVIATVGPASLPDDDDVLAMSLELVPIPSSSIPLRSLDILHNRGLQRFYGQKRNERRKKKKNTHTVTHSRRRHVQNTALPKISNITARL